MELSQSLIKMSLESTLKKGRSFLFNSILVFSLFLGCTKEKIVYKENEPEPPLSKSITLDFYLKDNVGTYGNSNWKIMQTYETFYSRNFIQENKRTDNLGYIRFQVPFEDEDEFARVTYAILELPDGRDWNDRTIPDYIRDHVWSPSWDIPRGKNKKIEVIIQESLLSWIITDR